MAPQVTPLVVLIAFSVTFVVFRARVRRAERRVAAARAEVERLNARVAELFEQAIDGIVVVGPDGRLLDANAEACRLLGGGAVLGQKLLGLLSCEWTGDARTAPAPGQWPECCECILRDADVPIELRGRLIAGGRWQGVVRDTRELRAAERVLRDKEAELARAEAVAQVGTWRFDLDRGDVQWSAECFRMFGVASGRPLTYDEFLAHVHPDDRERVHASWQAALAGAHFDLEYRLVIGDETKWLRSRAEFHLDGHDRPRWAFGTVQDITARKRVAEALTRALEGERQLRAEIEELHRVTVAVTDAVAEVPRTDLAAVLHVIALEARALTGARYVALGIGTDPERSFDPWVSIGMPPEVARQIGRNPRPVGLLGAVAREGRIIRERDLQRDPMFRGFPAGHPNMHSFLGVPIRFRGRAMGNLYLGEKEGAEEFTVRDQRLIEMLAARAGVAIEIATVYTGESMQRTWLQAIIDQMPEAIVIADKAGEIVLQNRAALSLGRRSPRELGGFEPYDVRDPSGQPMSPHETPLARARRGENVIGVELMLVDPEATRRPVLASAAPIVVGDDNAGVAMVFHDISNLKEIERMREEWTSIVAHDLRQPVATILLTAKQLLREAPASRNDRERRRLERVRDASRRLNRMIDDLLDASLVETHRLTIRPVATDLAALAATVVEQAREAAACPIRLIVEGDRQALVDPDRIRQVLENLLSNALKYGESLAEVRVEVRTGDHDVELAVSNRGPEIPRDQLPALFGRFARTPAARGGSTRGLGLGLYISRGILEAHGGRLWVERRGSETRFCGLIPGAAIEAAPPVPEGGRCDA